MFLIKEISSPYGLIPSEEDKVLAVCNSLKEIPLFLEQLGFSDCKTKLNEDGTKLYYKGKRVLYAQYN